MVRGVDTFSEHFQEFRHCYVVIGGVACDQHLGEQGLTFRATKDVDVILVVEAVDSSFIRTFWEFIKAGQYEQRQAGEGDRKYYRFIKPLDESFPMQLELFSRTPDLIPEVPGMTITPIPADEELSSLSAILMDQVYYGFTIQNSVEVNGIRVADGKALICLKAKAYVDLFGRKKAGESIDARNISKHKNDVFRLAAILTEEEVSVPDPIKNDLQEFIAMMEEDKPDLRGIFKEMGISYAGHQELLEQLKRGFGLQ